MLNDEVKANDAPALGFGKGLEDRASVVGRLMIEVFGPDGELKERRELHNLVVTAGKGLIASRMCNAGTAPTHMAIGTNSTAAAAGDTTLGTEAGRVALTSSTPTSNTATYVASFPAGTGTGAIVEAGILNASSGGTLLCRSVFSVVNKAAGDSMSITWVLTFN
jgi:hypothetical protein